MSDKNKIGFAILSKKISHVRTDVSISNSSEIMGNQSLKVVQLHIRSEGVRVSLEEAFLDVSTSMFCSFTVFFLGFCYYFSISRQKVSEKHVVAGFFFF